MQWYERSGAASIRCYAIASHKNWEEGLGAAAGAWGGGWGLQMTLSVSKPGVSVTANPTHTIAASRLLLPLQACTINTRGPATHARPRSLAPALVRGRGYFLIDSILPPHTHARTQRRMAGWLPSARSNVSTVQVCGARCCAARRHSRQPFGRVTQPNPTAGRLLAFPSLPFLSWVGKDWRLLTRDRLPLVRPSC